MNNLIIDILPLFLLIILLISIKLPKPISSINENYLSIDTLKYYKGFFAIVIIFHHLSQRTLGGIVFREFSYVGYLAVAAFFFYSGYGLQKSYMTKGDKYKKDFLKKRIPMVLIPYIIVTFIFWVMYYMLGNCYSLKDIKAFNIKGVTLVPFSWYIITILIFYFVYWILMKVCKKNYYAMIVGGVIWNVLYIICCMKLKFGLWWYNTSHMLIVGMLWAVWEKKLIKIIKRYQIIIPIIWIVFALMPIKGNDLYVGIIVTFLFVISIVLFSMKVRIGNKILGFLGEISFELYMIQGLFITILRSNKFYIVNEFAWSCLVLALTIISGFVLHILFDKLLTKYKKIVGV